MPTDNPLDAILADVMFSSQLVHKAIKAEHTVRVFPVDHDHYRTWVFVGPIGSVTYHDCGNGWCQIIHVETRTQQHERDFWQKLGNLVSEDQINGIHTIKPGFITDLLKNYGLYQQAAMLDL